MIGEALKKTVLIASEAGVQPQGDTVAIDRKFHDGMLEYAKRLNQPLACIVPAAKPGMGSVELLATELPYRIHVVPKDMVGAERADVIQRAVAGAALAYVGISGSVCSAVAEACDAAGVAYVAISEYTLRTELDIMRAGTPSIPRRLIRALRLRWRHRRKLRIVARAAELHANGYPTFNELADASSRRLLYFDTRARAADVIPSVRLAERLESISDRPARLIYSGRYIAMKGVMDVVKAGIELHLRGVRFQLDMYGSGPLKSQMRSLVESSGLLGTIRIHDPVPYHPNLITITREADLFLCGHVQGDPSCTYLETFACGVPMVGYSNEMWTPLCEESRAGDIVRVGDHRAMAECAERLLADRDRLRVASVCAREFALAHTMERAWDDRVSGLLAVLASPPLTE